MFDKKILCDGVTLKDLLLCLSSIADKEEQNIEFSDDEVTIDLFVKTIIRMTAISTTIFDEV